MLQSFFEGGQLCYLRSASARVISRVIFISRVISVAAQSVAATSVCYHKRGSPRLLLKDGSDKDKYRQRRIKRHREKDIKNIVTATSVRHHMSGHRRTFIVKTVFMLPNKRFLFIGEVWYYIHTYTQGQKLCRYGCFTKTTFFSKTNWPC